MSTLPAELDECVGNLEKSIGALESTLSDLLDQPMEEICPSDDPHAVARLQVSLAYALNASFFIYLKTQGVSPKDHPVKKELDRLKTYIEKLKDLESGGRKARVDVEASKRVIKHNTGPGQATPSDSDRNDAPARGPPNWQMTIFE
eukprot:c18446_g1_i3.p1 GENE.c18446_g1_i3~~c18446_g1_i3.p1  ORF type:complete len:146 (+),score=30.78 c18446_g1_i3:29-466(+)